MIGLSGRGSGPGEPGHLQRVGNLILFRAPVHLFVDKGGAADIAGEIFSR